MLTAKVRDPDHKTIARVGQGSVARSGEALPYPGLTWFLLSLDIASTQAMAKACHRGCMASSQGMEKQGLDDTLPKGPEYSCLTNKKKRDTASEGSSHEGGCTHIQPQIH